MSADHGLNPTGLGKLVSSRCDRHRSIPNWQGFIVILMVINEGTP
ncbi:hypothetical protein [Laspinema palackyanum]